MPRVAKKPQKKSEVKQSKIYTNMFEAFGAFWHRGFTEWAGTSSRSEYWWSCLMIWLISVVWVALIFISGFWFCNICIGIVYTYDFSDG